MRRFKLKFPSEKTLKKYRYREALLISLIAFFVWLPSVQVSFIQSPMLREADFRFTLRNLLGIEFLPNPNVVAVEIDEHAVSQVGRWPWDRRIIGDLLGNMSEASSVAMDILFSEPSNEESDAYLANKMVEANNVILGYILLNDNTTSTVSSDQISALLGCAYSNINLESETTNITLITNSQLSLSRFLNSAMTCGYFTILLDSDGIYRRYATALVYEEYLLAPLAIQSVRYGQNQLEHITLDEHGIKRFELGNISLNDANSMLVNFYNKEDVQKVSAYDIYTGAISPSFFKDKYVVMGVTDLGSYDIRPTPVSKIYPGLYVHYSMLSNLLDNTILVTKPYFTNLTIAFAIFLAYLASFVRKTGRRVVMYFVVILGVAFITNLLFFTNLYLIYAFYAYVGVIAFALLKEFLNILITEIKSSNLRKTFETYVSTEVVSDILKNPSKLKLGGVSKEISVLFLDIRGFTSISERSTPEGLVSVINHIFNRFTHEIVNNEGLLDKYIGDAIMALYNAPLDIENHGDKAVTSALNIMAALDELNREFEANGTPHIGIGIGINTDECIIGNIGSDFRFVYTAMGDGVNLAARLESITKFYQSNILISDNTYNKLANPSAFHIRMLDKIVVKGRTEPTSIYEVLAHRNADNADNATNTNNNYDELIRLYQQALNLYMNRDFVGASKIFIHLYRTHNDYPSGIFISRCKYFLQGDMPPDNWDGSYVMTSK